ncbi:hypothetical protein JTB14_018997 [Gonioctena quinquepunctata]|nr:hypothetical protein JTB14_018997 [Gonioctena quinquepunctata]
MPHLVRNQSHVKLVKPLTPDKISRCRIQSIKFILRTRKTRAFRTPSEGDLTRVRSEGRMKQYPSATDARAWSDIVEERRQHILELHARNKGPCIENIIPLDVLIGAIVANKDQRIQKLEKRIAYLEKLLDIYAQIDLTDEQKKKLDELKNELEKAQAELESLEERERRYSNTLR